MSESFDARALERIDSPEATAAAYFSHLRSPRATPEDHFAFESWYARNEAHRVAWAQVVRAWDGAATASDNPRILAMRESARANRHTPPLWRRPALALAASVVLLLTLGGVLTYQMLRTTPDVAPIMAMTESRTISTGIGQQAFFEMTDGSTVNVNTASHVLVAETDAQRLALVKEGEAFFKVAKNKHRPFIVQAGGVSVTAVGTAFAVRDMDGEIRVTLQEGRVRVDVPTGGTTIRSRMLEPGMVLRWKNGEARVDHADVDRSLDWRRGMISFDRTPLSEAVAEINRYTRQEIAIVSPEIAHRPISGSFRIGPTRSFLHSLEVAGLARVRSETAARVELAAP